MNRESSASSAAFLGLGKLNSRCLVILRIYVSFYSSEVTLALGFYFSVGKIDFTTKYGGRTVTGLVGASFNFTWSFSGDVRQVDWGLKKDGVNTIENNGVLVSLGKNGSISVLIPSAYIGRVSRSGDTSSSQITFMLSQIKSGDERFYGCLMQPTAVFVLEKFDSVYLAVEGEYLLV